MSKKAISGAQQGQSILGTSVMNEYLACLLDKRKRDLTKQFGVDLESADQILNSRNQRPFLMAIERFAQITPNRGAWFLCENFEFFSDIYREAMIDWELIDECLELGMAQMTVAELFTIRARNLSLLTGKGISKTSNRTRMSDNTEVLITTEVLKQIRENNSVFTARDFAKLMIRISRMISSTGATDESSIAPIIVFIYAEQFPFKIISQNYSWSDEESASIDVSPKREKREKRKKRKKRKKHTNSDA